jgi:hypothetical protein
MSTSKAKTIRVSFNAKKATDADVLALGQSVLKGVADPSIFPKLPFDLALLKAGLENYAIAVGNALDGGKKAIAQRDRQRGELIDMLRVLAFYVETICKDDMTKFLLSGFTPRTATRTAARPVHPPNLRVQHGPTGALRVKLSGADPQAWSHEVEYAPIGADGVTGKWMSQPVTSVASLVPVTGLTAGVTYAFHARSLGRLGFSEWSDSVTKMST